MKTKDRRNRNKIRVVNDMARVKDEKRVYSQPYGPYRVVSIVSLGGGCGGYFDEYMMQNGNGLYYSEEYKMNLFFQLTDDVDEHQLSYICRVSDIVVFFIDDMIVDDKRLKIVKRFIPSCLFCVSDPQLKGIAKKVVKQHFPKEKMVDMDGLIHGLNSMKIKNTSVCRRPHIVPLRTSVDEEFVYVEGFLKTGFLSDKVIVNGKYEMVIEEIVADRVYRGDELCSGVSIDVSSKEEDGMDCESESLMSMDECDSSGDEEEYDDDESIDERPSLIDMYSEYKGIRNLSTCDFKSYDFPDHYGNLVFFDNFKRVEKLVTNGKSVIGDNQMVRIKLRYSGVLDERIYMIFGCYEYEDKKTIYNFHFESDSPLVEEDMIVDLGHKIVRIRPTLTRNMNHNVFKRQNELDSGIISFIAPISFNISRVLIYNCSSGRFVSTGTNGFVGDRVIFDEVVLKGIPVKIKKRYSIIKRMFNNKDEVMYFRNIQLYVGGRKITGFIKKAIGTHGVFKGYFSKPVKCGDKVMMSLYKRVFLSDQ